MGGFSVSYERGRWAAMVDGDIAKLKVAITGAVSSAGAGLQQDLRRAVTAGGLGDRLPNAIAVKTYPERPSLNAAAQVYGKGPQAQMLLDVFSAGATIRASSGTWLLVPTPEAIRLGANRTVSRFQISGRGFRSSKRRTSQESVSAVEARLGVELDFVPPAPGRGYGLLVARKVVRSQDGTTVRRATKRRTRGTRTQAGRERIDVVLFILLRQVTLRARFSAAGLAQAWADRVPGFIDNLLRE